MHVFWRKKYNYQTNITYKKQRKHKYTYINILVCSENNFVSIHKNETWFDQLKWRFQLQMYNHFVSILFVTFLAVMCFHSGRSPCRH